MKANLQQSHVKLLSGATISLAVIFLVAGSQAAFAQSNTFPSSGSAGIGTTTPSGTKLHVIYNVGNDATVVAEAGSAMSPALEFKDAAATPNRWRIGSGFNTTTDGMFFIYDKRQSVARMIINTSGNVGIGTTTPSNPLDIYSNQNAVVRLIGVNNPSGGTSAQAAFSFYEGATEKAKVAVNSSGATGYVGGANAFQIWNFQNSPIVFGTNSSERLRIDGSGNVGIGTTSPTSALHVLGSGKFTGNLTVDGNIAAKYQDVAEWVPSSEQLAAGTVVVLDVTKSNQVVRSTESYDTRVAGVISEQPGIALGESGQGKVLVATTGRVFVKVDATTAPIHIGDLLVTSELPGVAMKSEPIKVGGRLMHMPGTLIGKALEPLEKGPGTILVLLSLQ